MPTTNEDLLGNAKAMRELLTTTVPHDIKFILTFVREDGRYVTVANAPADRVVAVLKMLALKAELVVL